MRKIALSAFILLAGVAYAVSIGVAGDFDGAVRREIHAWSMPLLTQLMVGITYLGSDVVLVTASLLFATTMTVRGYRKEAITLLWAYILAELAYEFLNIIFHRQRPAPFFGLRTPGGYSFPSGHAVKSTVVYVGMAIFARRPLWLRPCGLALAGLIGFSRVYLGVHYPTDVLAGYAAATICLAVCMEAYRKMPVWPSE